MPNTNGWFPDTTSTADPSTDPWVFGYGSLVDPADLALYLGYAPIRGIDWGPARLIGYERNWVVGMDNIHARTDDKFFVNADGTRFRGVVLSLGIAPMDSMPVNGVVFRTEPRFLPTLDRRERRYDRIDITDSVTTSPAISCPRVYTYVPRTDAVDTASAAIAAGTAVVPRAYHEKVRAAFSNLGAVDVATFDASTRDPDAPVVDLEVVRPGTPRHARG